MIILPIKVINQCFLLLVLLIPYDAKAWGSLGHKVICDYVWRDSSPEVRDVLRATAKRVGYKTFAESCVWADHIKGQPKYAGIRSLHFINIAKTDDTVVGSRCFLSASPQCVVTAIDYYLARIKQPSLSQRQRDEALLLVSHFVADLHQPLHVAYKADLGGNRRYVVFDNKRMSLHYLWDSGLLYCQKLRGKKPSWRRLGKWLYEYQDISIGSRSILVWADESLKLTQNIYQGLNHQRLAKNYCQTYYPVVMARLGLAGARLSDLLASVIRVSK